MPGLLFKEIRYLKFNTEISFYLSAELANIEKSDVWECNPPYPPPFLYLCFISISNLFINYKPS